jgi:acyl-[acyl-carrier-protein]-phospholipid O-acyltransferase/long-chain-fatty-acid--[acyl-carrier-protein] ligase
VATVSWVANVCVVSTTILMMVVTHSEKVPFPWLYGACALVALGFGLYSTARYFPWVVRLVGTPLVRLRYRFTVVGADHIPVHGSALVVCSHVSYFDGFLLGAALGRPVRYVVHRQYFDLPVIGWFLRRMRALPVSMEDRPRELVEALRSIRDVLEVGDLVCIFPEARMTRTGNLLPFRKGFSYVARGLDIPIIPAYMDGIWGSIWSYERGRYIWKRPQTLRRRRITVCLGEPMPSSSSHTEVRQAVLELGAAAWKMREDHRKPLAEQILTKCREKGASQPAILDSSGNWVSRRELASDSIGLAHKLNEILPMEDRVGVLLPDCLECAVVILSLRLTGRVVVHLGDELRSPSLEDKIQRSRIRTVITSRALCEEAGEPPSSRSIYVDDLMGVSRASGRLLSTSRLAKRLRQGRPSGPDSPAFILFSGGTEGAPERLILTEGNTGYQVDSLLQIFPVDPRDRMIGLLPLSQAWGLALTVWLPLRVGMPVAYAADSRDPEAVAALIARAEGTLLSVDTEQLADYVGDMETEALGTLWMILSISERPNPSVTQDFESKFGILPFGGYGVGELASLVSVNRRNRNDKGVMQVGNKPDTVGHPLPGTAVRIVESESGRTLPVGEQGRILVKSPGLARESSPPPEDVRRPEEPGWRDTGDLGRMDGNGFLSVMGRECRFSRVRGHLISHALIEEALHEWLGQTERVCAVTGVPGSAHGEDLVVLYLKGSLDPRDAREILRAQSIPESAIPELEAFVEVTEFAATCGGGLDIAALKSQALSAMKMAGRSRR